MLLSVSDYVHYFGMMVLAFHPLHGQLFTSLVPRAEHAPKKKLADFVITSSKTEN